MNILSKKWCGGLLSLLILSAAQATPLARIVGPDVAIRYDNQGAHFNVPIEAFDDIYAKRLDPSYYPELNRVAQAVIARPKRAVGISVRYQSALTHPDARKLALSLASRVADFLTDAGVEPDRIAFIQATSGPHSQPQHSTRLIDVVLLPRSY